MGARGDGAGGALGVDAAETRHGESAPVQLRAQRGQPDARLHCDGAGVGVAETMDGVEVGETAVLGAVVDLFTSLTPRKISLMLMIFAPVASNSRTVG